MLGARRVILGTMVVATCLWGCKTDNNSKHGQPSVAGHPDEIKDSTRLDAAPRGQARDTTWKPDSVKSSDH